MDNKSQVLTYNEAKKLVRLYRLKTMDEWRKAKVWLNHKNALPAYPQFYYENIGWVSWRDFLGAGSRFKTFEEAKVITREFGVKTCNEYWAMRSALGKNQGLPSQPERAYANCGWTSWGDFFGLEKAEILPYDEAKEIAKTLGINNSHEWISGKADLRKVPGMPSNPPRFYKDKGWRGWTDFLGREEGYAFMPFDEARALTRTLGINTYFEWMDSKAHLRRIPGMPANPNKFYKGKGWVGWKDFLGKDK